MTFHALHPFLTWGVERGPHALVSRKQQPRSINLSQVVVWILLIVLFCLREKNAKLWAERAFKLIGRECVRARNRYRLSVNGSPVWQGAHRPIKKRYRSHSWLLVPRIEVVCFVLVQADRGYLKWYASFSSKWNRPLLHSPDKRLCTEVCCKIGSCSYRGILPPSSKMVS